MIDLREHLTLRTVAGDTFTIVKPYVSEESLAQMRVDRLWDRLERKGIRPERLQLEWISAAEGAKFATVMRELERIRQSVTAEEIKHTRKVLAGEK